MGLQARSFHWGLTPLGKLEGRYPDGDDGTAQIPITWSQPPDILHVEEGSTPSHDLRQYLREPSVGAATISLSSTPSGWSFDGTDLTYSGSGVATTTVRLSASYNGQTYLSPYTFIVETIAAQSADATAPTIPSRLTASALANQGIQIAFYPGCDPKVGSTTARGLQDHQIFRDGSGTALTTIASAVGVSPQLTAADVGSVAGAGSCTQGSGSSGSNYSIVSNGDGIGSTADSGQAPYFQISGDFRIVLILQDITGSDANRSLSICIRESLAAGARGVYLRVNGTSARLRTRPTADTATVAVGSQITLTWPCALELVKSGDTYTLSGGADVNSLSQIASTTFSMSATSMVARLLTGTGGTGIAVTADVRQLCIQSLAQVSYLDAILDGASHSYTVRSRDGVNTSSLSASVSATAPSVADSTAPSVPTGLTGSGPSQSIVSWSWSASTDAQSGVRGYIPSISTTENGTYTDQAEQTGLSFNTSSGITASTTRWLKVKAVDNSDNQSAFSSAVSATSAAAPPADTTAPTVPTGNSAIAISSTVLRVSSSGSTDADSGVAGYMLFAGPIGGALQLVNPSVSGVIQLITSFPYDYNVGTASTPRDMQITAVDAAGNESARSARFSATTLPSNPSGNVAIYVPFEDGVAVPSGFTTSVDATSGNWVRRVVTTNPRAGSRCLETGITRSSASDYRSEISCNGYRLPNFTDAWYGLSLYLVDYQNDPIENVVFQVHDIPFEGQVVTNPPLALITKGSGFGLWWIHHQDIYDGSGLPNRRTYRADPPATPGGTPTYSWTTAQVHPSFHTLAPNVWYDLVFHVHWDYRYPRVNGLLEAWKCLSTDVAMTKVINIETAIGYGEPTTGTQLYYPKFGNYKALWRNGFTAGITSVLTRHDEIRLGEGSNAVYTDFRPGQ